MVSNEGRVKNATTGRILRGSRDHSGYPNMGLRRNMHQHQISVHRLVTAAFLGPCPKHLEVNHKDGNKDNNRIENLEYVTTAENMRHASALGLLQQRRRRGFGPQTFGTTLSHGRWQAQITIGGKSTYLGMFSTQIEAHRAYLRARDATVQQTLF